MNPEKPKKRRKLITFTLLIPVLLLIGGVVLFFLLRKAPFGGRERNGIEMNSGEDVFSAYGITNVASSEVTFPVKGMTSALEIEDIYIATGDTVESGTAILKFTEDSVQTAKEELQATLREKELKYRAAKIEYEQNSITYKYDEQTTELEGSQAEAVYQETISNLSSEVERTKKALDEANEKYAEYEEKTKNNSYYKEYVQAKAEYDENLSVIQEKLVEWGVDWNEITRGTRENYATLHDQQVTILSQYYSVLESNAKELENAEAAYQESTTTLANEMEITRLSIPGLEADYANAKKTYETSILEAKLSKEQTLNKADLAAKEYETNMEKAKADYQNVEEDYLDAKEDFDTFNECVKEGVLYAQESGKVIRTGIRKGREITAGASVYTVSKPENMTISASIEQKSIAKVSVGDSALVATEEGSTYTAVIKALNPVSSSDRGSVSYNVTLELTGEFAELSGNETVTIYFGKGGTQE